MPEPGPVRERTNIRAVIFDMDGVLTDSEPLINAAAIAMFKEKGLVVQPEDFLPFVGMGENRYIGGVAEKHHFPLDLPSAKARTYEIYLELVPKQVQAFPGARELVQACRIPAYAWRWRPVRTELSSKRTCAGLVCRWKAGTHWFAAKKCSTRSRRPIFFSLCRGEAWIRPRPMRGRRGRGKRGGRRQSGGDALRRGCPDFFGWPLQHADLVRRNLLELSVADLLGEPDFRRDADTPPVIPPPTAGSPQEVGAMPVRPWGFWATVGLAVVVLIAAVMAQGVAAAVWIMTMKTSRHGGCRQGPHQTGCYSLWRLSPAFLWFSGSHTCLPEFGQVRARPFILVSVLSMARRCSGGALRCCFGCTLGMRLQLGLVDRLCRRL